jgi:toxin ParE1/3/4
VRRRPRIEVRPRARRDIDEIADFIAQDSVAVGRRFYDAAQDSFRQLAAMPGMGRLRQFRNPQMAELRSWAIRGFEKFLIFYRATDHGIEVVRVLHGARDVETILEVEAEFQT